MVALAVTVGSTGCRNNSESGEAGTAKSVPTKRVRKALYQAVELSPEQLKLELATRCRAALAVSQPVLVEFSAPWCQDCRRLQEMKKEPVLADALKKTQFVTINVGDFDRHKQLVQDFDIRVIARWQLLSSESCETPLAGWKRLAGRTLEPETGKPVTAEQLAAWLAKETS